MAVNRISSSLETREEEQVDTKMMMSPPPPPPSSPPARKSRVGAAAESIASRKSVHMNDMSISGLSLGGMSNGSRNSPVGFHPIIQVSTPTIVDEDALYGTPLTRPLDGDENDGNSNNYNPEDSSSTDDNHQV